MNRTAAETTPRPAALRWVMILLVALLAVLAVLPVMMAVDSGTTIETILRENPALGPAGLDFAFAATIAYAAVLHLVYGAVAFWLGWKAVRGRRWARVALTVVLVLATLNSIDSATSGPEYFWWAIGGDVIHLAIIGLLWIPAPVRAYFAAHRAASAPPRVD